MTDAVTPLTEGHQTAVHLFGCGDLDRLFGHHPQVIAPWPRAPRSKARPAFDREAIGRLLRASVDLEGVDPRELWASQPWVLRRHADHYLTQTWERTGRTSADAHVELNRFPVIFVDHRQRSVIIAGHHRATAALVEGRPLMVRRAAGTTVSAVTPLLWCDPDAEAIETTDAAHRVVSGQRTTVPDPESAEQILLALGADPSEAAATIAVFEARRA